MDARAADRTALDDGDLLAEIVGAHRRRISGGPRTEHAEIEHAPQDSERSVARIVPALELAFDGDPAWRQVHVLDDGTELTLRPIVASDKEEMRRAFIAASPRTRYFRFLGLSREPSDAMLSYLCDVDQRDHVAIVATIPSLDLKTEEGVGVARFVRLEAEPDVAEAALTVRDDMQRRGIGKILMRTLESSARAHGIRVIRAEVLANNEPMRAILESAGARPAASDDGRDETVAYDIDLAPEREKTFAEILRAAAETAAIALRRIIPPSGTFAAGARHRERE
jgi:RimJ/RimL family protein N-acetyltransferase